MHRLASKAIERFVSDAYGDEVWSEIADQALPGEGAFEPMILDDPWITDAILDAAEAKLGKPRELILEDLGGYLVSHHRSEPLRRLLRFGGGRISAGFFGRWRTCRTGFAWPFRLSTSPHWSCTNSGGGR